MKTLRGYDIAQPSPQGSTDVAAIAGRRRRRCLLRGIRAEEVRRDQRRIGRLLPAVMKAIRTNVAKHSQHFAFAGTSAEIVAAAKQGKIAALIGIEGGHAIEDSLDILREFFRRGPAT